MRKAKDLTNMKFGRLTVIKRAEDHITPAGHHSAQWLCKCECGNVKSISTTGLYYGKTKSCGCYNKEVASKRMTIHGKSYTRIHKIWDNMKARCYNQKNNRYQYYGGKGITVCDEWKNSFEEFYIWAMKNGYTDELTIDRKDINKKYEPDNCRWITNEEQANNKSNNRFITFKGQTHTLAQWEKITNIKRETIARRISLGWNIEKALTEPVRR